MSELKAPPMLQHEYALTLDKEVPMTTQERAYTSPIWYTPAE